MKLQKYKPISSTIIVFLFLSAFFIRTNAQVYYGYDANGNRTKSGIVFIPKALYHDSTKRDTTPSCITLYPNPAITQVNVSIPCIRNCGEATLYMLDAAGNLLSTQKQTSTVEQISISSYSQGIYYLRIIMCNDQYSYKVIKTAPGNGGPANTHAQPPPAVKY